MDKKNKPFPEDLWDDPRVGMDIEEKELKNSKNFFLDIETKHK